MENKQGVVIVVMMTGRLLGCSRRLSKAFMKEQQTTTTHDHSASLPLPRLPNVVFSSSLNDDGALTFDEAKYIHTRVRTSRLYMSASKRQVYLGVVPSIYSLILCSSGTADGRLTNALFQQSPTYAPTYSDTLSTPRKFSKVQNASKERMVNNKCEFYRMDQYGGSSSR